MTLHSTPAAPLAATPDTAHEHGWILQSRHATAEGMIRYVRCTLCSARRIDLEETPPRPPAPISAVLGAAADLERCPL